MSKMTRSRIAAVPGVDLIQGFISESGEAIAIIGYTDEATYNRLVNEPGGAVAQAMADTNIESVGQWISSDRGVTM